MAETLWARSALLGVDRESIRVGSRLLTPQPPTPLLCPLSSCGSNFNSTSVFINPLLASQGDRIQTLTRISPPDWLDTATPRGHSTKKETHFFFLLLSPPFHINFFLIFPALALYIICPSLSSLSSFSLGSPSLAPYIHHLILFFPMRAFLSVSCLSNIPPPLSAWWTGAAGFWRSNLLTKTGWHQKRRKKDSSGEAKWLH